MTFYGKESIAHSQGWAPLTTIRGTMKPPIKEIRLTREVDSHRHQSVSVVRAGGHYGNNIALINEWVAIAKQTYPSLQDKDIKVVRYGGDRYAKTFGIEFDTPGDGLTAPDGWKVIQELEKTL